MLRHHLNTLTVYVRLEPAGPVLVKAGDEATSPLATAAPYTDFQAAYQALFQSIQGREQPQREKVPGERDMRFVRTRRNGGAAPYLPGSSLKGVLRARAEQVAREAITHAPGACDPFASDGDEVEDVLELACGAWLDNAEITAGPPVYWRACPVCRIFGHLHLAGRLSVSDAHLAPDVQVPASLPYRDAVGIDRQRGAARQGAKFDYEVWERGAFLATLRIVNFELWHLGLLAYVLHDLLTGELPVGYGTARGLGRLRGQIRKCWLDFIGRPPEGATPNRFPLVGIQTLSARFGPSFWEEYRFAPDPQPPPLITGVTGVRQGVRYRYTLPPAAQDELWSHTVAAWEAFIQQYDPGACRILQVGSEEDSRG